MSIKDTEAYITLRTGKKIKITHCSVKDCTDKLEDCQYPYVAAEKWCISWDYTNFWKNMGLSEKEDREMVLKLLEE